MPSPGKSEYRSNKLCFVKISTQSMRMMAKSRVQSLFDQKTFVSDLMFK